MLAAQAFDELAGFDHLDGVNADCGFVKHKHVWFVQDSLGYADALLETLGELAYVGVSVFF